ncbi:MAG TPA: DUF2914 domain-containing protein [Candidatus Paceibacterota bacterium]|nr:DUF2914 domain-containing protein [Candidatus Paceibacterota bacterium]
MVKAFQKLTEWYWKYERPLSSLGLIGGFLFDIFTLTRVDELLENIWVGFHLIVAAVGILMLNLYEEGRLKEKVPGRAHFWWTFVIQFAFGGLFSVYLVFYSRSANFFASWPFLVVLALNFLANERLRERYRRAGFQMAMLFLGIFFYCLYIVPIIVGQISSQIFILSGLISLAAMALFLLILFAISPKRMKQEKWLIMPAVALSYLLINFLYFAHVIPPIPLSLKAAGVYHSISRDPTTGNYFVTEETNSNPWYQYFLIRPTIHLVSGEPAYVFSSVFAPARFATGIVHRWQYYDQVRKEWLTESVIRLGIVGGRESGYRTFSLKAGLAAGRWRVSVETPEGQVIGRLDFNVEPAATTPLLQEKWQ